MGVAGLVLDSKVSCNRRMLVGYQRCLEASSQGYQDQEDYQSIIIIIIEQGVAANRCQAPTEEERDHL